MERRIEMKCLYAEMLRRRKAIDGAVEEKGNLGFWMGEEDSRLVVCGFSRQWLLSRSRENRV